MMKQELWNKILAFDLDNPSGEYGFSTRLASENYWTKSFTEQAILEYKKFMYLATTSDFMVSPSEIVDTVWHQHLIFTQSYQDFCQLLGKQIQHIPSTHNKEEVDKFKQAKERTTYFYEINFGSQPKNIWSYNDMFDSLNLEKENFKLRTFIIFGILAFLFFTIPAYFLLRPIYIQINNPYFIIGIIALTISVLLILELYNRVKLKRIVYQSDKTSFLYSLQPLELVYSKTQILANVINGVLNELIEDGTVRVNADNTIELVKDNLITNNEQLQIISVLGESGKIFYPNLMKKLSKKPVFLNTANSMDAFKKYFNKSKKFGSLFYTNFLILAVLLLLSFTRIIMGVLREKPVMLIVIVTIVLAIIIFLFLHRLTKQVSTTTIPNLYKDEILPERQIDNNWQWKYFLLGSVVLTRSFAPLVNYVDRDSSTSSSSSDSSCGSSCSSCGGCGGD